MDKPMSQSNDIRKQIEEILHSHANWSHRWDKDNPTTYIYGGDVMDTVTTKQKLLDLIEQSNREARIDENWTYWWHQQKQAESTGVSTHALERIEELQHPEGGSDG